MSQPITRTRKSRRPKPGSGFALVRLVGWLLKLVGGLLMIVAILSFVVTLIKATPTLIEALQYPEQKMAGLVILIISGGLLLFALLGLAGAISMGLGFACSYWGTEPDSD